MRKSRSSRVLVGCDPEGFLTKDDVPIPAIGLIGGTKERPKKHNIGAVQEDNVMWEFNIPPAKSVDQFDSYVETMLNEIRTIAKGKGYGIQVSPWAEFTEQQLNNSQAMTMGCEPDYNAWTCDQNGSVFAKDLGLIRVAAGHVHVGLPNPDKYPEYRTDFVRVLDLYLGLPSLFVDADEVRRKYYGRAGAYRPKSYGVEYRVLSNFWITESRYRRWVYQQVMKAYENFTEAQAMAESNPNSIQDAINYSDLDRVGRLMDKLGITPPPAA